MGTDKTKPRFMSWRDRRPEDRIDWRDRPLPWADRFGWHRGRHKGIQGTNARATFISLPFGQSSPPHEIAQETMPICLEGEIEFTVGPDRERFKLTKYDLLFIPANTVYEYTNVGRGDALFLGIAGCSGEWPIQSIYYLPGEDQPLIYRRPVSTD